jgi:hypothetical protein
MPLPWYVIVGNFLHIEVEGAAKVVVALEVLRADAGGIDGDVDAAGGQVLRGGDGARNFVEPATHQPDDVVTSAEVRETMIRIDLVCPGSGECLGWRGFSGMIRASGVDGKGRGSCKKQRGEKIEQLREDAISLIVARHVVHLSFVCDAVLDNPGNDNCRYRD